jgi:hypothetical protein
MIASNTRLEHNAQFEEKLDSEFGLSSMPLRWMREVCANRAVRGPVAAAWPRPPFDSRRVLLAVGHADLLSAERATQRPAAFADSWLAAGPEMCSSSAQTRGATGGGRTLAAWGEQVSALPAAGTEASRKSGASQSIAVSFPNGWRTLR